MEVSVNQRIKELRELLNINQTEFAAKLNVSQTAIWKIESGENKPSSKTIKELQRVFNVNPAWLTTGNGEKFIEREQEQSSNTWKDEAFESIKRENSTLKQEVDRLWTLVMNFTQNGAKPNFLKASDVAESSLYLIKGLYSGANAQNLGATA